MREKGERVRALGNPSGSEGPERQARILSEGSSDAVRLAASSQGPTAVARSVLTAIKVFDTHYGVLKVSLKCEVRNLR